MTIIPNQPFGLGDVIFTQTLVRHIADGCGCKIVWPVFPQFVEGLNRAYPDITFVDWRTVPLNYDRKDQYLADVKGIGLATVLPIRYADYLLKVPYDDCMKSKYMLYGLDWERWRECAMWERDKEKEKELLYMFDMAYYDEPKYTYPYVLRNAVFGSDCKLTVKVETPPLIGIPTIEMKIIEGISLFDWCPVMERAEHIHTVNTSIIYLLEMLDPKAKEVHLYQRSIPGQTFSNIDYILKRHKYVFHG